MKQPAFLYFKKLLPWFIFALAFVLLHWRYELNADEGVILNAAWDIINGRKLYVDTFEFIAPGGPYLIALWWKIIGISYAGARALSLAMLLSAAYALYLTSILFKINRWRWLAPAVFILASGFWQPINHNSFNIVAIIWGLYFVFKYLKNQNILFNLFISGFCFGISIIMLQHKGLISAFVVGCILLLYSIHHKRNLSIFGAYIIGLIIPLIPILIYWPLPLLYKNLIIFPALSYQTVNMLPLTLWAGTLAAALLIFTLSAHTAKAETKESLFTLCLVSVFLLITSLVRPDGNHVLLAVSPFFIVLGLFFEAFLTKKLDYTICLVLWSVGIILASLQMPMFRNSTRLVINKINASCPGFTTIYSGPFMPNIYFETKKINPTRYSFLITKMNTNEQFIEAANDLKIKSPDCIAVNYAIVEKFGYTKSNPVDTLIKDNYTLSGRIGNINILKRNTYAR